jgi:hypothetical protein
LQITIELKKNFEKKKKKKKKEEEEEEERKFCVKGKPIGC